MWHFQTRVNVFLRLFQTQTPTSHLFKSSPSTRIAAAHHSTPRAASALRFNGSRTIASTHLHWQALTEIIYRYFTAIYLTGAISIGDAGWLLSIRFIASSFSLS